MNAHRVETTLSEDKVLRLEDLPFTAGTAVEVIVLEKDGLVPNPTYPLRGSILRYDDPFEPAMPPEEWEALQ